MDFNWFIAWLTFAVAIVVAALFWLITTHFNKKWSTYPGGEKYRREMQKVTNVLTIAEFCGLVLIGLAAASL